MNEVSIRESHLSQISDPRSGGLPEIVSFGELRPNSACVATARLLGTRIRTNEVAADEGLIRAADGAALVFVFRAGVAVIFSREGQSTDALIAALEHHVQDEANIDESETSRIQITQSAEDRIGTDGEIILVDDSPERLLLVATILARSVLLAHDETLVSHAFDRSAPIVADLRENGRASLPIRDVMKRVGDVLAARHRVVGAVQASERPDLLWDHPHLDRLYARLEAEYELKDRAEALERKLAALGDFSDALLNIIQDKRAFRLEAVIIALIAFEIVLTLVSMAKG